MKKTKHNVENDMNKKIIKKYLAQGQNMSSRI